MSFFYQIICFFSSNELTLEQTHRKCAIGCYTDTHRDNIDEIFYTTVEEALERGKARVKPGQILAIIKYAFHCTNLKKYLLKENVKPASISYYYPGAPNLNFLGEVQMNPGVL